MEQQFVQAIQVLLNENSSQTPASLKEAGQALISIIQRNEGWGIITNVLTQAVEQPAVAQHCAIYLRNKIVYDFHQLQPAQIPELCAAIFKFIRMYIGRNTVLKQLALCFADLAIYFSPTWTTSIQEIVTAFPPSDQQNSLVLLHAFVGCAEEIANERLIASTQALDKFTATMRAAVGDILQFLQNLPEELVNHAPTLSLATKALSMWIPYSSVDVAGAVLHHKLLAHCKPLLVRGDETSVRCFRAVVKQIGSWIDSSYSQDGFTSAGSMGSYDAPQRAQELRAVRNELSEMLVPVVMLGLQQVRAEESDQEESLFCDLLISIGRTYLRDFSDVPFAYRSNVEKKILEALSQASVVPEYQRRGRMEGDASVPWHWSRLTNFWFDYAHNVVERDTQDIPFLPADEARLLLDVLGNLSLAVSLPTAAYAARQPNLGESIQNDYENLLILRSEIFELTSWLAPRVEPFAPFFRSVMDRLGGSIEGREAGMNVLKGCLHGVMDEFADNGYMHEEDRRLFEQVIATCNEALPTHVPESFVHAALRTQFLEVLANAAPLVVQLFPPESPQFRELLVLIASQLCILRLPAEQRAVDEWIRQGLQGTGSQVIQIMWDYKFAAIHALAEISNFSPQHIAVHLNTVLAQAIRASAQTLNFDQRKRLLDICVPLPGQLLPTLDTLVGPALQTLAVQAQAAQVDAAAVKEALFELSNLMRTIFAKRDSFFTQPQLRAVPELPGFVMQTLWPRIRDISTRLAADEVAIERATKALRNPFRLLGADVLAPILPEVVNFLMQTFAAHAHCSCLFMADWLGCMMNVTDTLKNSAAVLWDAMSIASLRHLSPPTVAPEELRAMEAQVQATTGVPHQACRPAPIPADSPRFHEVLEDLVGLWAHLCDEAPLFVIKSALLKQVIARLDATIDHAQHLAQQEGLKLLLNLCRLGGEMQTGSHGDRAIKPYGSIAEIAVQAHSENVAHVDRQQLALSYTEHARLVIAEIAQPAVHMIFRLLATAPIQGTTELCANVLVTLGRGFPEEIANAWLQPACARLSPNLVPEPEVQIVLRKAPRGGPLDPVGCGSAMRDLAWELFRRAHFLASRQNH